MKELESREDAITSFIEWYTARRDEYERLGECIVSALEEELDREGIPVATITSRAKKVSSVSAKIKRKNYTDFQHQLQDLVGVRVVTVYEKDVDRIVEFIRNLFGTEFECLEEESGNKMGMLNTDQFGYLSYHLVVKIKQTQAWPWKNHVDKVVEYQIRTTLQHGWAGVSHALDYKGSSMAPFKLRRRLHALSALLEIADNDFERMREELKSLEERYSEAIAAADLAAIGVDALSVNFYLQSDKFTQTVHGGLAKIQQIGIDSGMAPWDADEGKGYNGVAIARLALISNELDLRTLADLDSTLGRILPRIPTLIQEFMNELKVREGQFHADPVDILTVALSLASRDNGIGRGLRRSFEWSGGPDLPKPSEPAFSVLRAIVFGDDGKAS